MSRANSASGGPAGLILRTYTLVRMVQSTALASVQLLRMASSAPGVRCQHAFAATISASGAMPKIPMSLSALAAMTPTTAVPWRSWAKVCLILGDLEHDALYAERGEGEGTNLG
jgi:hypothetical protein